MEGGTPLLKMRAGLDAGRVWYQLPEAVGERDLTAWLGRTFTMRATGVLTCVVCGRQVKKFYGQGYCFPCLRDAPEAAACIVRPELCRAHLGEGRDPDWERAHHATEHVVYLSYTGDVKVGITRATNVPVRWIDQGAVAALVVARTPYRQLAGLIEVDLKRIIADRTNWRAMLRALPCDATPLLAARERIAPYLRHDLRDYLLPDAEPVLLEYPVLAWPPKVVSVQLARCPEVSGRLLGAKGQYLIWEDGRVLNVRNHAGWHVVFGEDPQGGVTFPQDPPLQYPGFGQ